MLSVSKKTLIFLPSAPIERNKLKKGNSNLIGYETFYECEVKNKKNETVKQKFTTNKIFSGIKPNKKGEHSTRLNDEQMAELCKLRRKYLAKQIGDKYQIEIWCKKNNDAENDLEKEVLSQIIKTLGLEKFEKEQVEDNNKHIWQTAEIKIEIIVKNLGNLGRKLEFDIM